ncbi:M4 family metallopeptidase [Ferruginibacter albus]|uniref:M4 family metallopeptidase n=1 Tax=Ferruginibacter albus TaxID=2875540 RepID=UPI001CC43923|nr:M4 family metallopeptidase [Ferruginibacter albus]UAY52317.1 M4 family metallopeptidase [Ferruginibacter albus]
MRQFYCSSKYVFLILLICVVSNSAKAQLSPQKKILNENLGDSSFKKNIKADKKIVTALYDAARQTPRLVTFKKEDAYRSSESDAVLKEILPVKAGVDVLKKKNENNPDKTVSVYRYQQYFKGIKVEQGSYAVVLKDGNISYASGEFYVLDKLKSIVPNITDSVALKNALTSVGATLYKWQEEGAQNATVGKYPVPELVIMQDYYGDEGLVLAYKFDIYAVKPLSRNIVYVSAVTGKVIYKNPLIHHANANGTADTKYSGTKNITTDSRFGSYRLRETRGIASGIETYNMKKGTNYNTAVDFTDGDNNWTNAEFNNANQDIGALDAHWGAETVYDYWLNKHNRKSWDGNDAKIKSYVHYDNAYDNAFFDGNEMNYGDGSYPVPGGFKILTTLDICGHEIGHGVCSSTCDLVYSRESGAMNEGFSDIWASCIEHYADPTASQYDYWLIGEDATADYVRGVNRDALRDMKNPKAQAQPDTYLGQYWQDATVSGCPSPNETTNDYCGVHTNSGVLNHWFYLVTEGGSGTNDNGNSYQFSGLGFDESEQIAFLTETSLTATSVYSDCRDVSINAATTLYGSCSKEVEIVTNAWYAVGVGAAYVPCVPTVSFNKAAENISETASPNISCPPSKTITLTVSLSSAASAQTDVSLQLSGTAVAGIDYTVSPSTVSFAIGETGPKNITITVFDNEVIDSTRTLTISYLVNANGGNAVAGNSFNTYALTITDDDIAPHASYVNTVAYGNYTTGLATSAFADAAYRDKKIQHIYSAADLKSYGLVPGTITAIAVNASETSLTGNVYKNFNFAAGFSSSTSITGSYISGLTNEYSNSAFTLASSWNTFSFSTPLVWDGVSSLVLQFCYNNTSNGNSDDALEGEDAGAGSNVTAYQRANSGSADGCSFTSVNNTQYRPILAITETVPQTNAETTMVSDTATLGPNKDVYFYSSTGKIMARVKNLTAYDYGCTKVSIDRIGSSSSQFWNVVPNNYLASKSFRITPTNNTSSGHYQVTLYYTAAEITGWQTATGQSWNNAQMVKVTDGHYVPDVSPSTPFTSSVMVVNATHDTLGTNYTLQADFNNAGFSGFGAGIPGSVAVLPVTITEFNGYNKNSFAALQWITTSEYGNKGFEIEKSYDGTSFQDIGFVFGATNSLMTNTYSFDDNVRLSSVQYYRLKQVDENGTVTYSKTIAIKTSSIQELNLLSVTNPFNSRINLDFNKAVNGVVKIDLMDITGKTILKAQQSSSSNTISFNINSKLSSGSYILKVMNGTDTFIRKLLKQ